MQKRSIKQEFPLEFPVAGIDVSVEYSRRPPGTTETGQNVRAFDTLEERQRGGSRPGLTKLVSTTVAGVFPVQHLAVLVDPTTPALDAESTGAYEDPSTNNLRIRNPGRFVRSGGSGRRTNRNVGTSGIVFVQSKRVQPGIISSVETVTLDAQPQSTDSLLLVIIRTSVTNVGSPPAAALVTSVTNANLNAFTQVGGGGYESEVTRENPATVYETVSLTMWYRAANAGSPDTTIRVTPGSSATYEIIVLEYKNAASAGPVSNNVKNADTGNVTTFTGGSMALNGTTGQLDVYAFTNINTTCTIDTASYTARFGAGGPAANMNVIERANLSGVGPESPTLTSVSARPYASIGIALTR